MKKWLHTAALVNLNSLRLRQQNRGFGQPSYPGFFGMLWNDGDFCAIWCTFGNRVPNEAANSVRLRPFAHPQLASLGLLLLQILNSAPKHPMVARILQFSHRYHPDLAFLFIGTTTHQLPVWIAVYSCRPIDQTNETPLTSFLWPLRIFEKNPYASSSSSTAGWRPTGAA